MTASLENEKKEKKQNNETEGRDWNEKLNHSDVRRRAAMPFNAHATHSSNISGNQEKPDGTLCPLLTRFEFDEDAAISRCSFGKHQHLEIRNVVDQLR